MKTISIALLTLAVCFAAFGARAQSAAAPATPPKPEQTAEATPKPKPAKVSHKSRRQQDARHCLDLNGNTAIIKCAEAYL